MIMEITENSPDLFNKKSFAKELIKWSKTLFEQ